MMMMMIRALVMISGRGKWRRGTYFVMKTGNVIKGHMLIKSWRGEIDGFLTEVSLALVVGHFEKH